MRGANTKNIHNFMITVLLGLLFIIAVIALILVTQDDKKVKAESEPAHYGVDGSDILPYPIDGDNPALTSQEAVITFQFAQRLIFAVPGRTLPQYTMVDDGHGNRHRVELNLTAAMAPHPSLTENDILIGDNEQDLLANEWCRGEEDLSMSDLLNYLVGDY